MRNVLDVALKAPDARRVYEEELLIGDVTDTIAGLLESLSISQRQLADRLSVTEGRVSQILAGTGNLTLRSLAAVGWALGMEFQLKPKPMANREATPAAGDPPAPAWLNGMSGEPRIVHGYQVEAPRLQPKFGPEGALAEGSMRVTAKGEVVTPPLRRAS